MEHINSSIIKSAAGIVQTMRARTSVLGAANPKYGRFDLYKSVREQIQIPESNLSRYDLVFAIEDKIEPDADRALADQILRGPKNDKNEIIEHELFKKYIAYARKSCSPVLSDRAIELIREFYVKTRETAKDDNDAKPITPRDLEAIKRLTIARARAELNDYADLNHASEVIEIYRAALKTLRLNPGTAGDIRGEKSKRERNCIRIAENLIKNNIKIYGNKLPGQISDEILEEIKSKCNVERYKAQEIYDEVWGSIHNPSSK
ncbi:MAG: hypothetical protein PHY59_00720 [Methanobacterium sp.]|nr:hypothetical protein [Methanobacterium sp.]